MAHDQSQPSSFVSFVDILGRDALRDFLAADLDADDSSSYDDYDHDHPDDAMASYWPFRRLFARRPSKYSSPGPTRLLPPQLDDPRSSSSSKASSSSLTLVDANVSLSRSPPASSFVASSPHLRPCSPPPCQLEHKSSYTRPSSLPPVDRRKHRRRAFPNDNMKRSNSTSSSFWTRPSSPIPISHRSPSVSSPVSPTPTSAIPHCPLVPSPPATTVGIAPEWDWYWRANHCPRPQSPLQHSPFTLPCPTPVKPLPRSFSYHGHREIPTS